MYRNLVDESTASFTVFTAMFIFDDDRCARCTPPEERAPRVACTPRDSRLRLADRESPETEKCLECL